MGITIHGLIMGLLADARTQRSARPKKYGTPMCWIRGLIELLESVLAGNTSFPELCNIARTQPWCLPWPTEEGRWVGPVEVLERVREGLPLPPSLGCYTAALRGSATGGVK